ncbi:hypothetical protein Bca4012_066480 [Brassica carinata]|uniref:Uncharacterized protein n=1 Tax=Brassica carinata TaxID=52824 RepID=A0A8X7VQT1_BRACI|nr:hypothetical protein Bca52824_018787 [Brassica carinata]
MPSELLKACYAEGNPSTLYIKGVQLFYSFDLKEEGLSLMKHAADAGYERAVIGKLVRSVKWAWGLWHTPEFKERMALFISHILPKFYSCQCGNPVERHCPCLWHIDVTKDDNMCPHCLWLKEIGLFLLEFEPVSLYRDTRKW